MIDAKLAAKKIIFVLVCHCGRLHIASEIIVSFILTITYVWFVCENHVEFIGILFATVNWIHYFKFKTIS